MKARFDVKHPTEHQPKMRWVENSDPESGVGAFERTSWDLLDGMRAKGMMKVGEHDPGIADGAFQFVASEGPYLVSAAEIAEALASAGTEPPARPQVGELHGEGRETDEEFAWRELAWREKWAAWLTFLRGASVRGGFYVVSDWDQVDPDAGLAELLSGPS